MKDSWLLGRMVIVDSWKKFLLRVGKVGHTSWKGVNTSTGVTAQRMDYDDFGKVIFDSQPGFQPFGFGGGIYDSDTRSVNFRARDFDATAGRWVNKDPIDFFAGDGNLYGYIMSDPVNSTDPDGKDPAPGDFGGGFFGFSSQDQVQNYGPNGAYQDWLSSELHRERSFAGEALLSTGQTASGVKDMVQGGLACLVGVPAATIPGIGEVAGIPAVLYGYYKLNVGALKILKGVSRLQKVFSGQWFAEHPPTPPPRF